MVAYVALPRESGALWNARRESCRYNLKQIAFATLQYRKDYDGFFPPVSSGEDVGWSDLLVPYSKSWNFFQCVSGYKAEQERSSDYFYNARLAQRAQVPAPSQVILFGDGLDNSGTNAHLVELPFEWKDDSESPAKRHWDGANYAFADGHVQSLRPSLIDGRDGVTQYSFEAMRKKREASVSPRLKK